MKPAAPSPGRTPVGAAPGGSARPGAGLGELPRRRTWTPAAARLLAFALALPGAARAEAPQAPKPAAEAPAASAAAPAASSANAASAAAAEPARAVAPARVHASHRVDVIAPGERVETIIDRMRANRPAPPAGDRRPEAPPPARSPDRGIDRGAIDRGPSDFLRGPQGLTGPGPAERPTTERPHR